MGKNGDNEVKWFDKKLGKGFSEFAPDAWQYEGKNGRIIELDPNSSKWKYIDPVQVVAESNPIQELASEVDQGVSDGVTGIAKGVGNVAIGAWNSSTQIGGPAGEALGIPNPLAAEPFTYNNPRDAAYAVATQIGVGVGTIVAGGAVGGSSSASVVGDSTASGELFNFSRAASQHMENPNRSVPVQILREAIEGTPGLPDPRGSRALMHTTEMWKNGKQYNLEVLYDKSTNSIWHFKYSKP